MTWAEFRDFIHGLLNSRDTRLWAAIQPPEQEPPEQQRAEGSEEVGDGWLMRDPPP